MIDFLRFAQPTMVWTAGTLIAVILGYLIIISLMKRADNEDTKSVIPWVKWITRVVIILLVVALIWQLIVAASVNEIPRSVIDRTGINFDRFSP